jgi:hypothetical protein
MLSCCYCASLETPCQYGRRSGSKRHTNPLIANIRLMCAQLEKIRANGGKGRKLGMAKAGSCKHTLAWLDLYRRVGTTANSPPNGREDTRLDKTPPAGYLFEA